MQDDYSFCVPPKSEDLGVQPDLKLSLKSDERDLLLKKDVIQPLVPQRLPCYDFIPVTEHTFGTFLQQAGWYGDFGCTKLP